MTTEARISKPCSMCGDDKPLGEYGPHPWTRDKLQSTCRSCAREVARRAYRADPAKRKAQSREWERRHPERVRAYWEKRKRRLETDDLEL